MVDVVAGLLMRDDKALLGLRKVGGKRGGLWECPGGKVDSGPLPVLRDRIRMTEKGAFETLEGMLMVESHEVALQREWYEELGIAITVGPRIATALLDLEVCFTVTLYEVHTLEEPQCLDHTELAWHSLHYAIESLPCSPALYKHWPSIRSWMAERSLRLSTSTKTKSG